MKTFLKVLGGIVLLVVALGVWLFGFGGCLPWTHEVSHEPSEVVGTRKSAKGEVVQKIIRQVHSSSVVVLFTPEGPEHATKGKIEYFLQSDDAPMVLLLFLSDREFHYAQRGENDVRNDLRFCDKFLPVTNSPVWVAVGTDPVGNEIGACDFHVVVFDENHLLSHRKFNMKRDYEHPDQGFEFDDGNQAISVKTPRGPVQKYDVMRDEVTDLK